MIENEKLWSVEGEAAVLGSMMLDPLKCIPRVLPVLSESGAFFRPENQLIFDCVVGLYIAQVPIDAVSVRTKLKELSKLKAAGGVGYIKRVLESVPSSANAVYYAEIIRDRQRYRQLLANVSAMQGVINEPLDLDEMIGRCRELVLEIEPIKAEQQHFDVKDHAVQIAAEMQDHRETIGTGFRNIDRIIGGISPGELIILASRPSMGKSALALDFSLSMARAGKVVLYFTLEMTHRAVIERLCCNMARVNMTVVKGKDPPQKDLEKLYAAALELKEMPIVLHEGGTTSEKQIAFVRIQKKIRGVDVIIVDYLQLMHLGARRVESRQQEITQISSRLKRLSMEEHVPVIALSQLNRQVESRERHRPRLCDLRESGSLEQDADVVLLLHREDYYRRNEKPDSYEKDGLAEAIIAKNKRGPVGVAELIFLEEYASFGDLRKNCQEEEKRDDGLFEGDRSS